MATVRWGSYALPTTILGNELSGLANGGICAPGTAILADGALYCDFEFVASTAFSPTTDALVDLWMLRSLDGGISYEDGSAGVLPPREADVIIAVRSGASILARAGAPMIPLPPGTYRPIVRNRTGVVFPGSGVTIRMASYTQQAT
jgi:hypothetical protein